MTKRALHPTVFAWTALRAGILGAVVGLIVSCSGVPSLGWASGRGRDGPAERPPVAKELDGPTFVSLPPEARDYLRDLALLFRTGAAGRILDQGEPAYAARVRPQVGQAQYAALLYRVGAYSEEGPFDEGPPPLFPVDQTRSLTFTGWTDRGPVAEVRGRITYRNGVTVPCTLYVLWKALPPCILGREP